MGQPWVGDRRASLEEMDLDRWCGVKAREEVVLGQWAEWARLGFQAVQRKNVVEC